jgi:predicted ATPase
MEAVMLTRIAIRGFRSLLELNVPLRPLTVLIGKNDSGKSTFLRAVELLASHPSNFDSLDRYRYDQTRPVLIQGQVDDREQVWMDTDRGKKADPRLVPAQIYQLPVAGAAMTSDGYNDLVGAQPLGRDGGGIPGLLDYLLRRDRKRFFELVDVLRNHVPGLTDIEIATPLPQQRRLDLVLERGFRMPADQASAGVRLLIFFIALTYHPSPPKVILLEEPETGLHPRRLAEVLGLLREITQGRHAGHPAQVILSTHSPYLLDSVDMEKDQVLVFSRGEDGSRVAEPADAARLSQFLDEFMLGEVWFNQGEEGLVAK